MPEDQEAPEMRMPCCNQDSLVSVVVLHASLLEPVSLGRSLLAVFQPVSSAIRPASRMTHAIRANYYSYDQAKGQGDSQDEVFAVKVVASVIRGHRSL